MTLRKVFSFQFVHICLLWGQEWQLPGDLHVRFDTRSLVPRYFNPFPLIRLSFYCWLVRVLYIMGPQPLGCGPVRAHGLLGHGPGHTAGGEQQVSECITTLHESSASCPPQPVCGKIVFHETGPRSPKGWRLLLYRIWILITYQILSFILCVVFPLSIVLIWSTKIYNFYEVKFIYFFFCCLCFWCLRNQC